MTWHITRVQKMNNSAKHVVWRRIGYLYDVLILIGVLLTFPYSALIIYLNQQRNYHRYQWTNQYVVCMIILIRIQWITVDLRSSVKYGIDRKMLTHSPLNFHFLPSMSIDSFDYVKIRHHETIVWRTKFRIEFWWVLISSCFLGLNQNYTKSFEFFLEKSIFCIERTVFWVTVLLILNTFDNFDLNLFEDIACVSICAFFASTVKRAHPYEPCFTMNNHRNSLK